MKHSTIGTMKPSLADFDDTECVGRALRLLGQARRNDTEAHGIYIRRNARRLLRLTRVKRSNGMQHI